MFIFYRGLLWKEQDNGVSRMAFHTPDIDMIYKQDILQVDNN